MIKNTNISKPQEKIDELIQTVNKAYFFLRDLSAAGPIRVNNLDASNSRKQPYTCSYNFYMSEIREPMVFFNIETSDNILQLIGPREPSKVNLNELLTNNQASFADLTSSAEKEFINTITNISNEATSRYIYDYDKFKVIEGLAKKIKSNDSSYDKVKNLSSQLYLIFESHKFNLNIGVFDSFTSKLSNTLLKTLKQVQTLKGTSLKSGYYKDLEKAIKNSEKHLFSYKGPLSSETIAIDLIRCYGKEIK